MEICFLRHALAIQRGVAQFPNDDRPLTGEGIQKMKKGARALKRFLPHVDEICTSPLVRALDTAKLAADALEYSRPVRQCPELLPDAGFREFLALLQEHVPTETILVVGHEPNLGKTVSALLGAPRTMIDLKKGGACLARVEGIPAAGTGTLAWHLTAKQLRSLA